MKMCSTVSGWMAPSIDLAVGFAAVYVRRKPNLPKVAGLAWKHPFSGWVVLIQSRHPSATVATAGGMSRTNHGSSKNENPKLAMNVLPSGIAARSAEWETPAGYRNSIAQMTALENALTITVGESPYTSY